MVIISSCQKIKLFANQKSLYNFGHFFHFLASNNKMISIKKKIIRQFILKIILFTALFIGIFALIYNGFPHCASDWAVWIVLLLIGYYNAWNWLNIRLKRLSVNERERSI